MIKCCTGRRCSSKLLWWRKTLGQLCRINCKYIWGTEWHNWIMNSQGGFATYILLLYCVSHWNALASQNSLLITSHFCLWTASWCLFVCRLLVRKLVVCLLGDIINSLVIMLEWNVFVWWWLMGQDGECTISLETCKGLQWPWQAGCCNPLGEVSPWNSGRVSELDWERES